MTSTPEPVRAPETPERRGEPRGRRREDRQETDRLMRAVFYGTVILIAWLMWKVVQPFALEIGWAVVLAICLNPIRNRLTPRMGATKAALAITLGVLFLVVVPTIFVGYTLYNEGATSVDYVQQKLDDQGGPAALFHKVWDWARVKVPVLPQEQIVLSSISSSVGRILEWVANRAGSIVAGVFGFLFSLLIMLSILFFLVRDSPGFARALRRVMPFEPDLNERFVNISSDLVSASVTSTLVVAAVQAIIVGIVLVAMRVPGAVLWALMTFLLSFLPLVGAAMIWVPIAIWLALSGHLVKGVVLALIGLLVLGNVDNVVRPLLLSGKGKINTLVLIISLMGGVSAFGFIGIVLGPLVAVLLTAIIESYASRSDDDLFQRELPIAVPPVAGSSVAPAAVLPSAEAVAKEAK
jgi:predicted PurR-regulated permease PerM